jgi:TonB-linked SusC/RagA family outer membrane protein
MRSISKSLSACLACFGVLSVLLFLAVSPAFASAGAQKQIVGKITNEEGQPLPGVSVNIKGSTQGTSTNESGAYSISASPSDVLVFKFLGYSTVERSVGAASEVNVQMAPDVQSLEQIVVTGYATQRKKDLTGAVSVVDVSEMTEQPAGLLTSQLQGRASGVTILGGGQPGEAPQIRIRGINTFGNNSPLFVVDGVPTTNINDLNPNDIATMQVLKDAGAASIYGSRAANGVITITTKSGSGKVKVNYDSYYGVQTVQGGNVWDILSPQEMADLKWVASRNTNPNEAPKDDWYGTGERPILPDYIAPKGLMEGDPRVDPDLYNVNPFYTSPSEADAFYRISRANKEGTDWFHEIFSNAPTTSHNLQVSGSNDAAQYLFSMNYLNQQGTLINTYLKRYTLRSNTQFNVSDRIRVGENISFSLMDNPQVDDLTEGSAIGMALRQQPIIPVRDIMGNYAGSFGGLGNAQNPVAIQERRANNQGIARRLFGNVFAEVDVIDNLTLRTSFGGELWSGNYRSFAYPTYENAENTGTNSYSENSPHGYNWTWTNTLQYKQVFNDIHDLTLIAGTEAYRNAGGDVGGTTLGYFSFDPNFTNLGTGSGTQTNFSNRYADGLFSFFGRADYIFNDRYLLGATLRHDGSSRFLEEQFGWFPSISAGWRVSEEAFMDGVEWLNDLKIRAGYGVMGNQLNVDPPNAFTTFGSNRQQTFYDIGGTGNTIVEGFKRTRVGNPDAVWEKNINSNIGFDATMFNGRLSITADYYRKDIDDLLYNPALIGSAGVATVPYVNVASMENSGFDIAASTFFDITSDFKLDLTGTFTSYNNEIVAVSQSADYFDLEGRRFNGSTIVRNQLGHSVGQFYGYQIEGFWDSQEEIDAAGAGYQNDVAVGRFRYADTDGDGQVTPDDRVFLGNPNPDFSYGLNIGANYKQFDFGIFLYGVVGNDLWNNVKWWHDFYSSFGGAKSRTALYDSWRPDNLNAKAPIQEEAGSFSTANVPNSYFVEKGSYLRAKNAQLGYTFSPTLLEGIKVDRLRIYVQAANLFTITNYSGLDPEVSGGTTNFGIDEGSYPAPRQFLFGVNLTF